MKRILITALICAAAATLSAQNKKADSVSKPVEVTKGEDFNIGYNGGHHAQGHPFIGLTFSRFDLGLATLVDNGSFTLSPNNQFLSYRSWKTSNVGFDVFQFGYRFSPKFKIYISTGWDWTHIRLRQDITILPDHPVLTWRQDTVHYSKNRFTSTYLRIPLSFDFSSLEDSRGNKFHFVVGPDIGLLLNGRVKQISDEFGKQKVDDEYHFMKMRYGVFMRTGYAGWGIFAKYYFNNMFEDSPAQDGLKNFSFGLTFGF